MPNFSLDRLNSVNPARAGMAAIAGLDALSNFTPEQQIAGMAVAFMTLLNAHGAHPSQAMAVASNLRNFAYNATPEIRAAVKFVRNDMHN